MNTIPIGMDFHGILNEAVAQCDVLLSIIGDQWLKIQDDAGRRRLDNPDDFVRIEIEAALSRKIPVIPVLIGKATAPRSHELPAALKGLAKRNAAEVRSGSHLRSHLDRLIQGIERVANIQASTVAGEGAAFRASMENWALEVARTLRAGDAKAKLFGVILYTDAHPYVAQMLGDNELWESLARASDWVLIIFSIRAAAVQYGFVEPLDGLGRLKRVWKEPAENAKLLESFEIPSTEHLPALLIFTESADGVVLKKAFQFSSDSVESSYSSLKLIISEIDNALAFLNDARRRTSESVFETVSNRLDAWQYVRSDELINLLRRNILDPLTFGSVSAGSASDFKEEEVFRYNPTTRLWIIAWHSSPVTLNDLTGFTYIRYLLLNKGEDVHVFDLEDLVPYSKGEPPIDIEHLKQLVNREWREKIGLTTIRAAREHFLKLETQLDEAKHVYGPDAPEILKQQERLEAWQRLLREMYFEPKRNPAIDKAVARVGRNVNTALEKLRLVELESLADHLETSISRGREYSYRPPIQVNWEL